MDLSLNHFITTNDPFIRSTTEVWGVCQQHLTLRDSSMLATRAEDSKLFSSENMLASRAEPPGSGQYGRAFYFGHLSPRIVRVSALWSLGLPSEEGEESQRVVENDFLLGQLGIIQTLQHSPGTKSKPQNGSQPPRKVQERRRQWDLRQPPRLSLPGTFQCLELGVLLSGKTLANQCGWPP